MNGLHQRAVLVCRSLSLNVCVAALALVDGRATIVRAEASAPSYQWTTRSGHVFEAKFVKVQGGVVIVERAGFEFLVPASSLSPASRELATHLAPREPRAIPATAAGPALAPASSPPPAPVASFSYGPSVLAYCQESVGQKIGAGQCASLAAAALKSVGAPLRAGQDWPGEGDYVWGELVAWVKAGSFGPKGVKELGRAEPGDIVQFHNARFSGYDHGDAGVYRMEARHHTAVLESVDLAHRSITVLHQNWNGHEVVRRQTLYLKGLDGGWLRFYRPRPESPVAAGPTTR